MYTLQKIITIILLSLILLGCFIIYIFYSINSLLYYSNNCLQSNLWDYLLLSLIFICLIQLYIIISNKNTTHNYFILFVFIISSMMIGWGIYELFFVDCINKHSIIYYLSLIYWIFSCILVIFILFNKINDYYQNKIAFTN
jgi:hypothetical protein